jgi:hypothetical protein
VVPIEAQIKRPVLDFAQRSLDLRRRQTGKGRLQERFALGDAEDVRWEPLVMADKAVQKYGAPSQFVHRKAVGVRISPVRDLRTAATGREHPGIRAADIRVEHGFQHARGRAAEDLVDDAGIAQIDMGRMHRREGLPLRPDVVHYQCEQARHAARTLEGFDGRQLGVEELQQSRMKRIVRFDAGSVVGSDRFIGEGSGTPRIQFGVCRRSAFCRCRINRQKEALCQHARQLGGINRDNRSGIARDDALGVMARALSDCLRIGLGDLGSPNIRQKVHEPPRLPREGIRLACQGRDHDQSAMRSCVTMKSQKGRLRAARPRWGARLRGGPRIAPARRASRAPCGP